MKNILRYNLKRCQLVHRYYKITRFYSFLKNTAYHTFFIIVIFLLLLLAVNYLIVDINLLINHIIEMYSPEIVISLFLIFDCFVFCRYFPVQIRRWSVYRFRIETYPVEQF